MYRTVQASVIVCTDNMLAKRAQHKNHQLTKLFTSMLDRSSSYICMPDGTQRVTTGGSAVADVVTVAAIV